MSGFSSIVLSSISDTLALGEKLGSESPAGGVIALCGGLGSGKTHLSKGITAGLGSPAEVTSPTFTLVHEYRGGRLPVFHFDFYRMTSPEEVLALGWDEYLETGGVCIVEWADLFPVLLPEHAAWWRLEAGESGTRTATLLPGPPDQSNPADQPES